MKVTGSAAPVGQVDHAPLETGEEERLRGLVGLHGVGDPRPAPTGRRAEAAEDRPTGRTKGSTADTSISGCLAASRRHGPSPVGRSTRRSRPPFSGMSRSAECRPCGPDGTTWGIRRTCRACSRGSVRRRPRGSAATRCTNRGRRPGCNWPWAGGSGSTVRRRARSAARSARPSRWPRAARRRRANRKRRPAR